jgi:hypothetical protein
VPAWLADVLAALSDDDAGLWNESMLRSIACWSAHGWY